MRFNWKNLQLAACACLLLLIGAGCSGINMSKSISPATFLLPGLLKADPAPSPEREFPADEPVKELAQF